MDIKALLNKQALNFADKPAVVFRGRSINFQQLKDASFALANYLLKAGVQKGDRVAVFSPNTPAALVSIVGIFGVAATLVPLDFMLSQEEIIDFINHSKAKTLFAHFRRGINLSQVKKHCPSLKKVIVWGKKTDSFSYWDDMIGKYEHNEPPSRIDNSDLAVILYTSGSTGHPKGVMLTFGHLDNPIKAIEYCLEMSKEDVLLCPGIPFSHIGGLDYIFLMLHFSSSLVLMERFQPYKFLKNIQEYKATLFWIVPAMYVAILSLKDSDKFDLSSLRHAVVFGAPSSPVLLKKFHKMCPNAYLLNGWGMTETSAPNAVLPLGSKRIESVGKFVPWMKAEIVDEDGNKLGPGQKGELRVKGEGVMLGYYKEPQLTAAVLAKDGWLKTGDIAYYDEDNLFYIVGRIKDMIKVGGEIVFSTEVEEKIHRHSKVKEAAVVGVTDKLRGEVPKAFIVVKETESLTEKELKEFLKKSLAHFKMPHYFEFVDELPKTRTGKIDKKKLKDY